MVFLPCWSEVCRSDTKSHYLRPSEIRLLSFMLWQQCHLSPLIQQIPNSLVAEQEVCMGEAILKYRIRNSESKSGVRNLESGIRNPKSGNRLPESVLTRPPTRSKQLFTVSTLGFQFGFYDVVTPISLASLFSFLLSI